MAKPVIGDCYIGEFPITQVFGVGNYAKFGLRGHNGIDFGVPQGTQIIAATDGIIIKVANDVSGYGNFVEIWDDKQLCATLYAHLDHAVVSIGDRVFRGQLLGISDNTGNSTGAHLHFSFCLTDEKGVRLNQDNGYYGWVDPNQFATWQVTSPKAPIKKEKTVDVPSTKFEELVKNSGEYDKFVAGGYKNIEDVEKKVEILQKESNERQDAINTLNDKVRLLTEAMKKDSIEDHDSGVKLIDLEHKYNDLQSFILSIHDLVGCPQTVVFDEKAQQCLLNSIKDLIGDKKVEKVKKKEDHTKEEIKMVSILWRIINKIKSIYMKE